MSKDTGRTRLFILPACLLFAFFAAAQPEGLTLDKRCRQVDHRLPGPYVAYGDGRLGTVDKNIWRTSTDNGTTWSEEDILIDPGVKMIPNGHTGQILRTTSGTLILLFLDFSQFAFDWDDAANAPKPECRLELCALRSTDEGKTWSDKIRLLDGYNADFTGLIQLKSGRIIATVEHLEPALCRWNCGSFYSDDEGKSWNRSNWIDLGGRGHHDGALEPAVVELNDGRVMMLIRTNLDRFWAAYSDDQGRYWREICPTMIEASSAPAWLTRLRSGRLVMVWNPLHPAGKEWKKRESGSMFEEPASWYREELCIAFSEDEGKSWTAPVTLARYPGKMLAYPYIFEYAPGKLWVASFFGDPHLVLELDEKDFAENVP